MPPTTQEEFLKDLEQPPQTNPDPFETPLVPEPEKPKDPVVTDEHKFNRRERRQNEKLQAEREANIALAAKLEVLTEAQKISVAKNPAVDETISRIYGTATPEGVEATALLSKALSSVEERATERALEVLRKEQAEQNRAVAVEEETLDTMLEDLEDDYGVSLTSKEDESLRKGFFQLLEKLSPKDREGSIIQYADHRAVWEELQNRQKPAENTRARDVAARSMTQTGGSPTVQVQEDVMTRYLKDNGLL